MFTGLKKQKKVKKMIEKTKDEIQEQIKALGEELKAKEQEEKDREELLTQLGKDIEIVKEVEEMDKNIEEMREGVKKVVDKREAKSEFLFKKYGERMELILKKKKTSGGGGKASGAITAVRKVLAEASVPMKAADVAKAAGLESASTQLNRLKATGEAKSEKGLWESTA